MDYHASVPMELVNATIIEQNIEQKEKYNIIRVTSSKQNTILLDLKKR